MKLILASNNQGKIREIKHFLENNEIKLEVKSLTEVGIVDDIDEFGVTLYQNALIKAEEIAKLYPDDIVMADDSGLFVKHLDYQPGVYSARYANDDPSYKENKDKANYNKLLTSLEGVSDRFAYFQTVMCLIVKGGDPQFVHGRLEGDIATSISVEHGFGYDPVFIYQDRFLSELTVAQKNEISHRKNALDQLLPLLVKAINNEK